MSSDGSYSATGVLDPAAVSLSTRSAWCISQTSSCLTLCGGNERANTCLTDEPSCQCLCSSGIIPDLSLYEGTLPSFVNAKIQSDCINEQPNSLEGQEACQNAPAPGTLKPSRIEGSTTSTSTEVESSTSRTRTRTTSSSSVTTTSDSSTVSSTSTPPSGTVSGTTSSITPTSTTSTAPLNSPTPSGGLSTGAKAGIGIGAALGVIILLIIAFFLYRRRSSKRGDGSSEEYIGKAELPADGIAPATRTGPHHELDNEEARLAELAANSNRPEVRYELGDNVRELDGNPVSGVPGRH